MEPLRNRNHHVPEFYLRKFLIADKPNKVYVYERGKIPRDIHVRYVAVINGFYIVKMENTGEKSDIFEKMFDKFESIAAPLLNRFLVDSIISISNYERNFLAHFITLLYMRGPAYRQRLAEFRIQTRKSYLQAIAQDREVFDRVSSDAGVEFKDSDQAEKTRQSFLNFDENFIMKAKGGEGDHMKMMMEGADIIQQEIINKKWTVLEAPEGEVFVTSDSPVTLLSESSGDWRKTGKGFMNSSVVFPLSPSRCLLMTTAPFTGAITVVQANRQQILEINRNTMTHALNRMFSNLKRDSLRKAFDKHPYHSELLIDIKVRIADKDE